MFKMRRKSILLMLILSMGLVFTACGSDDTPEEDVNPVEDESNEDSTDAEEDALDEDDAAEGEDIGEAWELDIETPEGETVKLTDEDMEEVGIVDVEATIRKKDGTEEENKWTGMPLKNILDFAGIEEYNLVEIEAADGFTVEYTPEIVESDGTILATKVDGEKLDEDSGPVQSVVDGEGAKLWIKQVVKVKASN